MYISMIHIIKHEVHAFHTFLWLEKPHDISQKWFHKANWYIFIYNSVCIIFGIP